MGRRMTSNALGSVALAALGIAAVILGGADDSPGLQGIGVLLVVSAGWWWFRRSSGPDGRD